MSVKEAPLLSEYLLTAAPSWRSEDILFNYHQWLAVNLPVDVPYFEFSGRSEQLLGEFYRNGFDIKIGRVSAFTNQTMATFVQSAAETFVAEGTLGDIATEGENADETRRELIGIFAGGFTENTVAIIVEKDFKGEKVIVGGCLIKPGERKETIGDLVGEQQASIPTLVALKFSVPKEFLDLASTPEIETYGVTRLFRLPDTVCGPLGLMNARAIIADELITGISKARVELERLTGRVFRWGIADISSAKLLRKVNPAFGWKLVSDEVTPTEAVMRTVLKHHYGYFTTGSRRIYVIVGNSADVDREAEKHDRRLSGLDGGGAA